MPWKKPKGKRATRHLYLANCGASCGDTLESVSQEIRCLCGEDFQELQVGDGGVSYLSFEDVASATKALQALREHHSRWKVVYAARDDSDNEDEEGSSKVCTAAMPLSLMTPGLVPGLIFRENFVSAEEAERLLAEIDSCVWVSKIKRRVQHYGYAFNYAKLCVDIHQHLGPLPSFCDPLLQRISAAGSELLPSANLDSSGTCSLDQLTINEYVPMVGIAFHVDAHSSFEDGIVILSLGSGIAMEFRRPDHSAGDNGGKAAMGRYHRGDPPPKHQHAAESHVIWLPPNSLMVFTGAARYGWQHGIAGRKYDRVAPEGTLVPRARRVSLTFRTVQQRPCQCAWPAMCDSQNPECHALPCRVSDT